MKVKFDFELDFDFDSNRSSDAWLKQHEDNFNQLLKQDRKAKTSGSLVGRFIDEPVADGKAFYVITKENKKTVRIHAVFGIGDNYQVSYWGVEATIDKTYVQKSINSREYLKKLFKQ